MSAISDGGPAFPRPVSEIQGTCITHASQSGMSLRDYFAGQALEAFLGGEDPTNLQNEVGAYAVTAYSIADAMLLERNGPPSESEYKKLAISIVREAAEQAKLGKL